MDKSRFVPADRMWVRIRNMLPGRRGSPRRDLPEDFGNWNSASGHFRSWSRKGVFDRIFKVLSESFDLERASVDGAVVQAHAKVSGGQGGGRVSGRRTIQGRVGD